MGKHRRCDVRDRYGYTIRKRNEGELPSTSALLLSSGADQFALIDAPGHQKYIGNLLAGVASVDIGLLVIACDQGVQAQTIEHTAILNLLGVEHLIVALTRTDLSSENSRQEIREEMEYFLAEQGIEQFDTVFTSTETGEGLKN